MRKQMKDKNRMSDNIIKCGLHKSIPDSELPRALLKPLIFGDRSQIVALNDLEIQIEEMETDQAKMADGRLKRFNVTITYSGEQEFKILAVDRVDAEKKARQEADHNDADIEINWVTAREA